jgi:hypothetical protein
VKYSDPKKETSAGRLEAEAARPSIGIMREFWDFARTNKKWWLMPVIMVLLLFGALMFLSATGAAPFIYALF